MDHRLVLRKLTLDVALVDLGHAGGQVIQVQIKGVIVTILVCNQHD